MPFEKVYRGLFTEVPRRGVLRSSHTPVLCSRVSYVETLDTQPYVHKTQIITFGHIMSPS
jgi:hypothetical protein